MEELADYPHVKLSLFLAINKKIFIYYFTRSSEQTKQQVDGDGTR